MLAAQVPPPRVTAGECGCDVGASHPILAAIDARMGEIYTGTFMHRGDRLEATSAEAVIAPADVALAGDDADWIGMGTGFAAGEGVLAARLQPRFARIDAQALPHAADLARHGIDDRGMLAVHAQSQFPDLALDAPGLVVGRECAFGPRDAVPQQPLATATLGEQRRGDLACARFRIQHRLRDAVDAFAARHGRA